jgi:hypothetical protein
MNDLRDAFRTQSRACVGLGSPFMGRLMALCAERLVPGTGVADRVLTWPGDVGPSADSVPLRLAGALHGLVRDGADAGLTAVYPPAEAPDDALWAAVEAALTRHEARLLRWLDSPPQTNEVRRSGALLAAAAWIAGRHPLPFVLSELGASAGLNLSFDRFALDAGGVRLGTADSPVRLAPEWRGAPPEPHPVRVTERAGVDLNPLDPQAPGDRLRLLAYLWPDQPERLRLTEAAIALAGTRPDRGDAAEWLEARLATPRPGRVHMVYHTIAWQYFPPATQARCRAALAAAGARATAQAPLAHVGLEADDTTGSAALSATLWPGGETRDLARVDFHGRWIAWAG